MMWNMILRRVGVGLILLWVVSVLIFVLTQVLPGDAAQIRLGQNATPETLAALRKQLGLDQPLYVQYFTWITNLLTGDLGVSNAGGATIASLIGNVIGNTAFMAAIVTAIAVPLSVVLGLIAAMYPGQLLDRVITSSTLGLIAVPDFFVAIFLILFLAVQLGWVPAVSYLSGTESFWKSIYVLHIGHRRVSPDDPHDAGRDPERDVVAIYRDGNPEGRAAASDHPAPRAAERHRANRERHRLEPGVPGVRRRDHRNGVCVSRPCQADGRWGADA